MARRLRISESVPSAAWSASVRLRWFSPKLPPILNLLVARLYRHLADVAERIPAVSRDVHAVTIGAGVSEEGVTHEERAHALGEEP